MKAWCCAPLLFLLALAGCQAGPEAVDEGPNVRRILRDDRFDWVTVEADGFRIHFPSGSFAESQERLLPGRAEEARRTVLSRLAAEYAEPVDLFYLDSREDMERLTGRPVTGFSYFEDRAILLVFNDRWKPFERHELTHIVTMDSWPNPAGPAVTEGVATYVDGRCGGYENGRIVRTMLDRESLIPLETLAADFREQDDLIAYLQAGSIIDFMVHRRGPEAIHVLWKGGLGAAPGLLRDSTDEFQDEFETWLLSTYDPVPPASWQAIREGGCGIDARPADRAD